jgi:hypothetical protein
VLLFIFGFPRRKEKIQKKKKIYIYSGENKKIIAMRRGCQSAQKMTKNWLKKFENTKIKI